MEDYRKFKNDAIKSAKSYIKRKDKKGFWGDSLIPKLLLVIINELSNKKPKRKLSAWQKFSGEKLKEGLSMREVGKLWRAKKI